MKRTAGLRRVPVPQQAQSEARNHLMPAPTRGWVANENLASGPPGAAIQMDNWFPETDGVRLRKGSELYATIGSGEPVLSLFRYKTGSTEKFFGGNATTIYDISDPADPEVSPDPVYDNLTGGDFSTVPMSTSGGDYLVCVNGMGPMLLYDGSDFSPISSVNISLLAFDARTGAYTNGNTVTGGTSGASATIVGALELADNTGVLYVGAITGTFQDNETLTDGGTGSSTSNIPSGVTTLGISITNVPTSDLSDVTVYRNRLYFVEKDSLSVWYLPVDVVGGAATEYTLQGIFLNAGTIVFADTWSLDAGDGVDDKFVVMTTEGEVAVFEGGYPGDSSWNLVGRYDAAIPLHKNATFKAGGDLLIATKEGIIPLSQIIQKDPAALSLSAVTRSIEPEWQKELAVRGHANAWTVLKWIDQNMLIVGLPTVVGELDATCFVANLESGAWARYTGWNVRSLGVFSEDAYFGTHAGTVMKAESTGLDGDDPYICKLVWHFTDFGHRNSYITALSGRTVFTAGRDFIPQLSVSVDYTIALPSAPQAETALVTGGVWDVDTWDNCVWDSADQITVRARWFSLDRSGFRVAPQVQVTCGDTLAPDAKLVSLDIMVERGAVGV